MNSHIVAEEDDGIRLDRWFKRHQPGIPHALLEKNLRKGLIRLDGKKAKSSERVRAGQVVGIRDLDLGIRDNVSSRKPQSRIPSPADARMIQNAVLYKDDHIIVVNKPFGLPVQGGSKIAKSLDDMLDAIKFEAKERPRLVHRLDRDTSGCLALARDSKTATILMRLFSGRSIEKTYWALVNNLPDPLRGTIDLPIVKKSNPKAQAGPPSPATSAGSGATSRDYEIMVVDEAGQKAVTEYRVVEHLARKFALVELRPLTGRTHQLRVHMAAIGCPIVGDHKYGGGTTDAEGLGVENILHLHARKIVIPLPGCKAVSVTAPLPEHMKKSFKALGIGA